MYTYWLLLKNDFLQTSKHHDEAWFRYLHWKSVIRKKVDLNIFGYWAAIFYNLFSNLSRLVETCPSSWKIFSIFFSSDSFKFHWVHHQAKPPSYPHGNGVTPWSKHGYRPNYLMDYWHRSSVRSLLEMTSSSYYCLHFLLVKVLHSRYLVEFSKQNLYQSNDNYWKISQQILLDLWEMIIWQKLSASREADCALDMSR